MLATGDNTTRTVRISRDMGATWDREVTNASVGNIATGSARWGAGANDADGLLGSIGGGLIVNVDLSKAANAALLAVLTEWVRDRFGLDV